MSVSRKHIMAEWVKMKWVTQGDQSLTHLHFQETCREIKDRKCISTVKYTTTTACNNYKPSFKQRTVQPAPGSSKGNTHPNLTKPKDGRTDSAAAFSRPPSFLYMPMVVERAYVIFKKNFLPQTSHFVGLQMQRTTSSQLTKRLRNQVVSSFKGAKHRPKIQFPMGQRDKMYFSSFRTKVSESRKYSQ